MMTKSLTELKTATSANDFLILALLLDFRKKRDDDDLEVFHRKMLGIKLSSYFLFNKNYCNN